MTNSDRAYDLRRRAERRGDAMRASVSLHLEAEAARRRARAMDAGDDEDTFVAADSGEVKPVPLTDDDVTPGQFVAQLNRRIPIRTNPGNEREVNVPWKTRQEQQAEEWFARFEEYLAEIVALPARERRMVLRVERQHLHTMMSAAERRSVDLLPGGGLARLDRFLEELERLSQEQHPATPLRGAVVRQQEQRVRAVDKHPSNDLDYFARRAAESMGLTQGRGR